MLLDGYGLVYRAFFALPDLTTSKGTLVKGVFGFASIVLRGLQDLKPDYLAVSFDLPGPTFRHEQYAEYKATRTKMPDELRDQFPMVREVVKALRIPVYELQGYEADDVIGDDHPPDGAARRRDDDRHRRPRHAPAGHPQDPADDDALGRREHGHLRRRQDRRAVRAAAGPDDRLQGAQGRSDRQHPGCARCGREDRRQAHRAVRPPRGPVRAARERHPGEAAREAPRAPRPGVPGPGAVADRARPAGHVGPRSRAPRRLRSRDRRPAVPGVRVPDADRPAATAPGRGRRVAARGAPWRDRERHLPGGAGAGTLSRLAAAARAIRRAARR